MSREEFEKTLQQYHLSFSEVIPNLPDFTSESPQFYRPPYIMWAEKIKVKEKSARQGKKLRIKGQFCTQAHSYRVGDQWYVPEKTTYRVNYVGIVRQ